MLTHNQQKYLQSLKLKKYRRQHNAFIVEGRKSTAELLVSCFSVEAVFATEEWCSENETACSETGIRITVVTGDELRKISDLSTPDQVLAVVKIPVEAEFPEIQQGKMYIMLDGIRDPGNLGTIIRTADWFGIDTIYCSPDCVDVFNPKVIQATMGSFCRVKVHYAELGGLLKEIRYTIPVYGALLQGPSLHEAPVPAPGIILIGNESNGITPEFMPYISNPVHIPAFTPPGKNQGPESLNASIANAIICYELCKQLYGNSP